MSATCSSPSCESRRRETASYSYRPCCALVVDLMCHCTSGLPRLRATSSASSVLPVPGSPLTSSGRSSVTAALTASIRSGVAMYVSVPSKRIEFSLAWRILADEPAHEPEHAHTDDHRLDGILAPPCDQACDHGRDQLGVARGEVERAGREEHHGRNGDRRHHRDRNVAQCTH